MRLAMSGQAAPAVEERLAEHLKECSSCGQTVEEWFRGDTLLEAMRRAGGGPELQTETSKLLAHVKAAVAAARTSATDTQALQGEGIHQQPTVPPVSAPAAPAADRPAFDFLAPPQAGDELGRLGPYRVLKVLGQGGMGVVFQAEDPRLGRLCALKAMLPHMAQRAGIKERFLREARAAAQLESDYIVPVYQVDEDRGVPYIAMPYLKGASLESWLRARRKERAGTALKPNQILKLARDITRGLAAAHAKGMVHRDIKPDNVWLDGAAGGRARILDFGLARLDHEAGGQHLTQTGAIMGTPAYMAPEQAAGKPVDGRADLFSLGVVLYRLCTGALPFGGTDPISTLMALATHDPPPPRELNPAIGPGLSRLVMRLLAKDPTQRPDSADALLLELQAIVREEEQSPPVRMESAQMESAGEPTERPVPTMSPAADGTQVRHAAAPARQFTPADIDARVRGARELLQVHSYQEAVVLLEEIPDAENLPVVRDVLADSRRLQADVESLVAAIEQARADNDRRRLRAALRQLWILKPQRFDIRAELEVLERQRRTAFRMPLPGRREPLDIPWVAAWLAVAALMIACGAWAIVRDKDGREIGRVAIPKGGSLSITADEGDAKLQNGKRGPSKEDNAAPKEPAASAVPGNWPADSPAPAIAPFDAAQARQRQEQWAAYLKTDVEYENSVGMKFALIPPGEFLMGTPQAEIDRYVAQVTAEAKPGFVAQFLKKEGPQRKSSIEQPFYLGVHEVSQKAWSSVMGANPSANQTEDGLPVDNISWLDALAFCNRLSEREGRRPSYQIEGDQVEFVATGGYRLPIVDEWEYACRAGTHTKYFFGDEPANLPEYAWFSDNSGSHSHPVGRKPANHFGLFDVYGNVSEFAMYDRYSTTFKFQPRRGGSAQNEALYVRSAATASVERNKRAPWFGLRVLLPIPFAAPAAPSAASIAMPSGTALKFNGRSHVRIPTLSRNDSGPVTLEAWVRPELQEGPKVIALLSGKVQLQIHKAANRLFAMELHVPLEKFDEFPSFVPGKWVHVAAVCDDRELRLYVDGRERWRAARQEKAVQTPYNFDGFWLGGHPHHQRPKVIEYRLIGQLDEIRVSKGVRYRGVFSPSQRFEPDADTLALYHCDEGQGNVLRDSSGNDHHGTIEGAKWVTP